MCTARNSSGELALLSSLDDKFVNNFLENNPCFNKQYIIAPYRSNRVTISRYRKGDLQSIMCDTQLFLQPQILHHKEHLIGYTSIKMFWGLSAYLTEFSAAVAIPNSM
jgi:hypothetical protein